MEVKTAEIKPASVADRAWMKIVVKYIILALAFVCDWRVNTGDARPFATGLMIAVAFAPEFSALFAAPLYVVTALVAGADFRVLVPAAIAAVACIAVRTLAPKFRGKRSIALKVIAACVAAGGFFGFGLAAGSKLYAPLGALFSLCFAFVAYRALSGAFAAGVKPTDADMAGAGIVLCVAAAGAFTFEIFGVRVGYVLVTFAAGVTVGLLGKGAGLFAAALVGLGGSITLGSTAPLALATFVGAAYLTFSDATRLLSAVAAVMATVLAELYFFTDAAALPLDMLAFFLGGALYAAIPQKAVRAVKAAHFSSVTASAFRYVTERKNAEFAAKINGLSEIFSDMRRALSAGSRKNGPTCEEIAAEAERAICAACEKRAECDGRGEALLKLSEIAEKNGRAGALDVPYFIENDCPETARFLSLTAEYAAIARGRNEASAADREERAALVRQLKGVSDVLARAAYDVCAEPGFDDVSERALKAELSERGIPVAEAIVAGGEERSVAIFTANKNADPAEIAAATGKVLGGEYRLKRTEKCAYPGYAIVEMTEKPPFDAVFAVAGSSKNSAATGDTHSFVRVGANKFMCALCDGMGSGREAGRISETAVELVESFFRAGFPGEFVLEEVNRFLSADAGESFAAFDILLCDLFTRERTIVKLGSPASYVKTPRGTTAVEGSALPLGALDEISPFVNRDEFQGGDVIVFVSDGVSDLFSGDELKTLINETSGDNVETLVGAVMSEAKTRAGGVNRDDMTVTAVRVFKRN